MAEQSLKDKTVKGVVWSSIERFSVLGVQFLVMLVMARLLSPKEFGLVGMLTIFIAVADSLVNSGFSQALIRKQNRTNVDNSTIFYFNIISSVVIYGILYAIAPLVSRFYNQPELTQLMRVLCLVVIITSFGVVQLALYTATINFKTQAKATLTGAIISGFVGIWLAWQGAGVWALVWQQLTNAFVYTLLLWLFSPWRPKWIYSWISFNEMFSFGWKLLVSGLIDTLYNNLYQLVIGKVFTAEALGHFSQAKHFPNVPASTVTNIVQRVTYPSLCTLQDDDLRLRSTYRQMIKLSAFVVFPMMSLLAAVAVPLVELLIGAKWHYAATLIIPLSFSMMWYPIHVLNLNLLKVKGRSDLFLRLEIIKKIIGVIILVVTIPYGLTFMCWFRIVSSLISLFINTYYTGKLLQMGFLMQMRDLMPTLLASLAIFVVVLVSVDFVPENWQRVVAGLLVGTILYLGIVALFRFKEFDYALSLIGKYINKQNI